MTFENNTSELCPKLWTALSNNKVQCQLCSHFCVLKTNEFGRCKVRFNQAGALCSKVIDDIASINLDPVEKKPLFHFLPSTNTLSFGTLGCNMSCSFCQNWEISQPDLCLQNQGLAQNARKTIKASPLALVLEAKRLNAASISYTYNEPTVFYELMQATAGLAIEHGLANIMVSNGFQSPAALEGLQDKIHAANIDLKSSSDAFYRDVCGARRDPVWENIKAMRSFNWWLEATTLIVPTYNDSEANIRGVAAFIAKELGVDTPWHISAFRPAYKFNQLQTTTVAVLQKAIEIGQQEGLNYIYAGNVPGHHSESTSCPECGELFAARVGYVSKILPSAAQIEQGGECIKCGFKIAGVWNTASLFK